jgi:hypothetical protein
MLPEVIRLGGLIVGEDPKIPDKTCASYTWQSPMPHPYFPFNKAGQFTTSIGGGCICRVSGTIIRKRCPSPLTTYRLRPA